MLHHDELTTYETTGGGIFRLVGAPDKPSVLNTGSFKKSKLTKKELKELNIGHFLISDAVFNGLGNSIKK